MAFTGAIGGHRYYSGNIGYALGMTLTLGGFGGWTLMDVFIIGKRLEHKTFELEREATLVNAVSGARSIHSSKRCTYYCTPFMFSIK